MASEATIRSSLQIVAGNIEYQSRPAAFVATVTGRKGPVPGAIQATTDGISVDFSQLDTPALCRIQNLDLTNYVTVGIWEPDTSKFYPLMELLPGESYVFRLSRDIGEQYAGTGTGTDTPNNAVRIKANTSACNVLVEAFEV